MARSAVPHLRSAHAGIVSSGANCWLKSVYCAAMIFVACSGFPVPVSRYWGDFPAVELSDTELGIPGAGTVRRWKREAPDGFAFTLIAPQTIAESGFRRTKDNKRILEQVGDLVTTLSAHAAVFVAADDYGPDRKHKAAVKSFVGAVPATVPHVVLDLPAWTPAAVAKTASQTRAVVAYNPLLDEPPPPSGLAYLRLPGPAGKRSRYDDAALDEIADHCRAAQERCETVFCVFRNIDMHANATSLIARLR